MKLLCAFYLAPGGCMWKAALVLLHHVLLPSEVSAPCQASDGGVPCLKCTLGAQAPLKAWQLAVWATVNQSSAFWKVLARDRTTSCHTEMNEASMSLWLSSERQGGCREERRGPHGQHLAVVWCQSDPDVVRPNGKLSVLERPLSKRCPRLNMNLT